MKKEKGKGITVLFFFLGGAIQLREGSIRTPLEGCTLQAFAVLSYTQKLQSGEGCGTSGSHQPPCTPLRMVAAFEEDKVLTKGLEVWVIRSNY